MTIVLKNKMRKGWGALRQTGVTMLEMLGTLAIAGLVLGGVAQQGKFYIDNVREARDAQHLALMSKAAWAYVRDNKTSWNNDTTFAAGQARSFNADDFDTYLPAGWGDVGLANATYKKMNTYGQYPCLYVKKVAPATPGADPGYNALLIYQVATSGSQFNGATMTQTRAAAVALMAGVAGGYVDTAGKLTGTAWQYSGSMNVTAPALGCPSLVQNANNAGVLAASLDLFEPADVRDMRYLCRDSTDNDCNQMNVRINATSGLLVSNGPTILSGTLAVTGGSATISGNLVAKYLRASGTEVTNTPCTEEIGTIATSSATASTKGGELLTCQADPNNPTLKKWRPSLQADTEPISVYGCDSRSEWCRYPFSTPGPTGVPSADDINTYSALYTLPNLPNWPLSNPQVRRLKGSDPIDTRIKEGFFQKKGDPSQRVPNIFTYRASQLEGAGNNVSHDWVMARIIGGRTMCALSQQTVAPPLDGWSSSGTVSVTVPPNGGTVSGIVNSTSFTAPKPSAAYCAVKIMKDLEDPANPGLPVWVIRMGAENRTRMGCSAVCLK